MTQSQFASLHSITIGTVKRWWKKGYLAGIKSINGRVSLTGKYTKLGMLALCGQRNVLEDERRLDAQLEEAENKAKNCSGSPTSVVCQQSDSQIWADSLRAIAGQLVGIADRMEEEGQIGKDK